MKAIITVKLPKNLQHNPHDKQIGNCPLSNKVCTDVTGEHHSYIESGRSKYEIIIKASKKGKHITRMEVI